MVSSPIAGQDRACVTASIARRTSTSSPGSIFPAPAIRRTRRNGNTLFGTRQRLFELWRLWNGKIQEINPNASYIANAGGGALSLLDMKTIGELAPTLLADRQGRAGVVAPWASGKSAKEFRSTHGTKSDRGNFQRRPGG